MVSLLSLGTGLNFSFFFFSLQNNYHAACQQPKVHQAVRDIQRVQAGEQLHPRGQSYK